MTTGFPGQHQNILKPHFMYQDSNQPQRRCIVYPQDIQRMTGLSMFSVWKMFRDARKKLGKPRSTYLTLEEFCACTHFELSVVQKYMLLFLTGWTILPAIM